MTASFTLSTWVETQLAAVEHALTSWVPASAPAGLGEAMRYAVLDGGKRLRPLLVMAAAEAARGHRQAAMRAACAVPLTRPAAISRRAFSATRHCLTGCSIGEVLGMVTGTEHGFPARRVLSPPAEGRRPRGATSRRATRRR